MAKQRWTETRRQSGLERRLRGATAASFNRRRFAQGGVTLGISTVGAGALGGGRAFARQDATPEAFTPIGEELDLANLSPNIPEPTEPVTITFQSWVNETEMMPMLRDRFQELHPNITVEFTGVPAEEMDTRLTTQIAGGNPPDTVFLDMSSVVDYASRDALLDLEPYIAESTAVVRDDYVGAFLDSVLWEDKMYGLPIDGESTGLFYRTDLFEEAGIAAPPTTWEELEAAAQALTSDGQYGYIMFAPEAAYYWYPYLWQNGGRDSLSRRHNHPLQQRRGQGSGRVLRRLDPILAARLPELQLL